MGARPEPIADVLLALGCMNGFVQSSQDCQIVHGFAAASGASLRSPISSALLSRLGSHQKRPSEAERFCNDFCQPDLIGLSP